MPVRFGNAMSNHFSINNGVKQEALYLQLYLPFILLTVACVVQQLAHKLSRYRPEIES